MLMPFYTSNNRTLIHSAIKWNYCALFAVVMMVCCQDEPLKPEANELSRDGSLEKSVSLMDNLGRLIQFEFDYRSDDLVVIRRSIGGFYENLRFGQKIEVLVEAEKVVDYLKEGKLWFVPNSLKPPIRLTIPRAMLSDSSIGRASNEYFRCFCEHPTPFDPERMCSPGGLDAICSYMPSFKSCLDICCEECDIEFCIQTICFPETRGGGVFILADSVVCVDGNPNTIYGGNIKVSLSRLGDTIYFKRRIVADSLIFGECYFNATGTSISNALAGYDSTIWLIPFNPAINAFRFIGKSCQSDPGDVCNGVCLQEEQPNGCYRCQCSLSSGVCDLMDDGEEGVVPTGVIVKAHRVVEEN